MGSIERIIKYNRLIDMAIAQKNFDVAVEYQRKLHKIEIRERAELGAYRIKGA